MKQLRARKLHRKQHLFFKSNENLMVNELLFFLKQILPGSSTECVRYDLQKNFRGSPRLIAQVILPTQYDRPHKFKK